MKQQVADLAAEDTPQLYVACGRGPCSTLRVLRHGLEVIMNGLIKVLSLFSKQVTEMAVSELPANPNAVWTVKKSVAGNISFVAL